MLDLQRWVRRLCTPGGVVVARRTRSPLDVQVKLDKDPKLLGVYFSTMHTFSTHCKKTASKAKKKLNVLKALAGTDWGQDKETLLITYKATCKSVLEYGSPVWSPNISDTSWSRLQTVQNSALRHRAPA